LFFLFPVFNYTSAHDVWEVTKSDYEACTSSSPLNRYSDGNTVVALTETGTKYFYCNTSGHCKKGMKLEVTVVSSTESDSPPSPTPIISPPSPTDAAAMNGVGCHYVIALVLGAMLMIFV
jgi:Plastocyanin-like domain